MYQTVHYLMLFIKKINFNDKELIYATEKAHAIWTKVHSPYPFYMRHTRNVVFFSKYQHAKQHVSHVVLILNENLV
jgi:hypothetical protein